MSQRPIKFRAWDPKQKEFYFPPALNEFDEEDGRFFAEYASRTIFQQFTGLHDKNGKEIWEGDILRSVGNVVREVRWNDRYARFSVFEDNQCVFHLDRSEVEFGQLEVIGNIYENPESLTPKG